jgi:hypothetical protein
LNREQERAMFAKAKKGVKISDVVDETIKGVQQENTGKIADGKPVYFFRVDHSSLVGNQNFEKNLKHEITKAIQGIKYENIDEYVPKTEIRVYNNKDDKNPDLTLTVSWLQRETKKRRFSIIDKDNEHRRTIIVNKNNKKTAYIVGNWVVDP